MKGSKKQIKWAEDIKSAKQADFDKFKSIAKNAAGAKAIDFIQDIDDSCFWIDYRDYTAQMLLESLFKSGLRIKGFGFSHSAKMDMQTGEVVVTWTEIVADGKGGHVETMSKTI